MIISIFLIILMRGFKKGKSSKSRPRGPLCFCKSSHKLPWIWECLFMCLLYLTEWPLPEQALEWHVFLCLVMAVVKGEVLPLVGKEKF